MSRSLSSAVLATIYARETSDAELALLTIEHAEMVSAVRLVRNQVDVTSRSNTYTAFPFDIQIPPEREGELPRVDLLIGYASQELIAAIRSVTTPPTITFELILASDPDTVIAGPWVFSMRGTSYNAHSIRSSLQYEPLLEEPYPVGRFTPTDFPGLFNAVAS